MMGECGWVLLDSADKVLHEVECLMSLLEEEPLFVVFEGVKPLKFYPPKEKNNTNIELSNQAEFSFRTENSNQEQTSLNENFSHIKGSFQSFIAFRDYRSLSPALRSRCFCVHL
jgi:hypothetical protein